MKHLNKFAAPVLALLIFGLFFTRCIDHKTPPKTDPITADTIGIKNGVWFCATELPADEVASLKRSTRPPSPLDGVAAKGKQWPLGSTIHVGFLAGSQIEKDSVKRACTLLSTYANINFDYPESGPYDIRVDFAQNGAWSYIGTDAKFVATGPTVNLASWALNQRGAYVHEFQHAVSLLHEQQHPSGVCYDTAATLAYYRATQGWSDQQIYWNVITRHNVNNVIMTQYDKNSNMHYPIPAQVTCNKVAIPGGRALTGGDISTLKLVYPGRGGPVPPPTTTVTLTAAQVTELKQAALNAQTATNAAKSAVDANRNKIQTILGQ